MFNVSGGELMIILVIALVVLGPEKLPEMIRKVGRVYGELRRMSSGFQEELRGVLDEPLREVRETMDMARGGFSTAADDAVTTASVVHEPTIEPPVAELSTADQPVAPAIDVAAATEIAPASGGWSEPLAMERRSDLPAPPGRTLPRPTSGPVG